MMDWKEAAQQEKEIVERYEKDLNFTFVAVRHPTPLLPPVTCLTDSCQAVLFVAANVALAVIAPPGCQTTLLRGPPSDAGDDAVCFYQSSVLALLGAIFALFAKDRLNGFLLREGGPSISRDAAYRRQQVNTLNNWRFRFLLKTPRCMLQIALSLPVLRFDQRLWLLSPSLLYIQAIFVVLVLVGYVGTDAAGDV